MTQILKCQIMLKFKNMSEKKIKKKVQVVVIFWGKQEVLLLEFNSNKNQGPIGFQNITGSVEEGEDFLTAAKRELEEEIGVVQNVIDLEMEHSFKNRWDEDSLVVEKTFLCLLKTKPSIVISEEHQGYKWVNAHETKEADYTFPSNFLALKKALMCIGEKS